jgi:hypothetical protein
MATVALIVNWPKLTIGWNHLRSLRSAGVSSPSATIATTPRIALSGTNTTAAVVKTINDGLANKRSLTSTDRHSKYTAAVAKANQCQIGSGND